MGGRARGGSFERNVGGADYGPEVGGETSGDDSRRSKGGPIRCGAPLHQCREVAAADGLCRNPRNDAEEQSVFSRNKPHIQEHDLAHANYVESTTADVHKAGTELKENTVPVVDGLENTVHSRLEDKAEDSSGMGLEKGDGDVEYQYGDWMRASGGRQRSPPRDRTASPKQQAWRSEKHGMNGDAAVHGENIGIHPDFQQPKPVINEMEQIQGDRSIADMDVVSLNLNSDNPVEVYDNKVGNRDMVEKSVISDIPKDVMGPKFVEDVAEKLEENSGHLNVKCNMQEYNRRVCRLFSAYLLRQESSLLLKI
nr:hypothetical protein CFP56_60838 [Quercus suber]